MPGRYASLPRAEIVFRPTHEEEEDDTFNGVVETADVWRILWCRRNWIALATIGFALAALLYCLFTPAQYTATAQLLVDPRDKQVVGNDVNPSTMAADGGLTQIESQAAVIQSNGVLLRAIAATQLVKDPEFNGSSLLDRMVSVFDLRSRSSDVQTAEEDLKARTLPALQKSLKVKRADKVLVIDVSVASRDADKSARLANAITEAYLADQADARAAAGRQASEALSSRLAELQEHVQDAENAIENYRAANNMVVSSGQLVSDLQLNEATAQLSAAQNRTAALKAALEHQDRDGAGQGTPEATQSGVVARLRERESALVEKLSSLQITLGPRHPDYTATEASLKQLQELIAKEVSRLNHANRAEYERALSDEKGLAAKLETMKRQSLNNDRDDVRLRELQRGLDSERTVYQSFLLRAKETAEQANIDTTNARVITRALPPQKSSWPPTGLLVFGAAVAGLGLSAGGSLLREYWAPVVISKAQATALARAPLLGVLRHGRNGKVDATDPVSRRLFQLFLASLNGGRRNQQRTDGKCLIVGSREAEASDRSTVAEMIASVAADQGKRVLFIDAAFDTGSEPNGFACLLRGDTRYRELIRADAGKNYLRIDNGLAPRESRRSPVDYSEMSPFDCAVTSFDLTVIDIGSFARNPDAGKAVAGADGALLVAKIAETPHEAIVAEAEAVELGGGRISAVLMVDNS